MAVTLFKRTQVGARAWRVRWTSDAPDGVLFRVFVNGRLYDATRTNESLIVGDEAAGAVVEVLDDNDALPALGFSGQVRLEWDAVPGAAEYVVEVDDGGWTTIGRIRQEGQTRLRFSTDVLADGLEHDFRVTPIGVNGNAGDAALLTVEVVRHPDPPNASYTGNAGRTVTVDHV